MLERNRDCARVLKELDLRADGGDACAAASNRAAASNHPSG
mgnify:CR=1 FL=1